MPMPADHLDDDDSSGSDFGGMDLGLFSGGYAGNLTYGTDVGSPRSPGPNQDDARRLPSAPSHSMYGTGEAVPGDDEERPRLRWIIPVREVCNRLLATRTLIASF